MLNIQCQCGGTALQWRERKELWRLECCCSDCSAGMRFLHETKGGPQPPNYQMLDTLWLPNDFSVTRGLQKIGVVRLSADSRNTLFYCKECGTSLITDHVVYQGKVVITQIQNYSQFQGMSSEPHMAVKARHFVRDLDPNSIDSLPPFAGPQSEVYDGVSQTLVDVFPILYQQGATGEMNAQKLAALQGITYAGV